MKKYFLPIAFILFTINSDLFAGTVAVSDAQNVAMNFFKTKSLNTGTALTATLIYTKNSTSNVADFYVFNMSPAPGFVIVAADDRVIPILAYSTESSFKTNFSHVGLNDWVNQTSVNVELAIQHNSASDARIEGQWSAYRQGLNYNSQRSGSLGPLCTTRWDQEMDTTTSPPPFLYNLFCPYIAADTQRCLTGCVATAMAQVMKYWNYPAQGSGSYSYRDERSLGYQNNIGTLSSNFSEHTYQWSLMPTELLDSTSYTEDSAVDLLMYDCAISVGMDFGDDDNDGSAANSLLYESLPDSACTQYALPKYFGYDPDTIRGIIRSNYTDSAWIAVIEHEINVGRPIVYEGDDATQGGHAWVCDGYDASGNLHMNWGWGGYANGFFAITNLSTPPAPDFNPILDNDALIGILPKVTHSTAGIDAPNNGLSFSIFPNPTSNQVILQSNETGSGTTWEFKNILGQTVLTGNIEAPQTHINISGLTSGIYMVELRSGEKSVVKKLVVSR